MGSNEDNLPEPETARVDRTETWKRQKKEFDSNGIKLFPPLGTGWDMWDKYMVYVRHLTSKIYKEKSRYREDFEEMEQMGEGSFGRVFKCKARADGKLYAIKQIQLTALDTESEETRTMTCSRDKPTPIHRGVDEAASEDTGGSSSASHRKALLTGRKLMESFTMSQLEHPNVIRHQASWIERLSQSTPKGRLSLDKSPLALESDAMLYIQMELCECHSLKRWLTQRDRDGKLDPVQNIAIFAQIVHGLHYIHRSGYFHRDIKPANILLNPAIPSAADLLVTHRRKSTPSLLARARSPLGALSSRVPPGAPTPPPLNRVTSLPSSKLLQRTTRAELHASPPPPPPPPPPQQRSPSLGYRSRADSVTEKSDDTDGSPPSSDGFLLVCDNEKDKEITFDANRALKMSNYIAKIGDFGLATNVALAHTGEAKDTGSPKSVSPTTSPPPSSHDTETEYPHFSLDDERETKINRKTSESTPKVSPLPTPYQSESPPANLTCACQKTGPSDGDEPRPCRRAGLRTCGIGTTLYAAPEQLYSHHYGTPVDIFSLGLILVELYSTAESRKDRYKMLKRARKGMLDPSLVEAFPQETELILKMLSLNPMDRPTTADILRNPLLHYFTQPSRCTTPVLRRSNSNSLLALPSPLQRSRSGRAGPTGTPDRAGREGPFQDLLNKPLPRSVHLRSADHSFNLTPTSFSFGSDETRKSTPVAGTTTLRCSCAEELQSVQITLKEHKETMDQMMTKMQTYEEQLKAKDSELQALRESVHSFRALYEKMQHQFAKGRK